MDSRTWRGTCVVAGELCRRRVTRGAGVLWICRVLTQGTSEDGVATGGQFRRQQRTWSYAFRHPVVEGLQQIGISGRCAGAISTMSNTGGI